MQALHKSILKDSGKIDALFFRESVKPCGDGEIFAYSLIAVFIRLGVHIEDEQVDDSTVAHGDVIAV